MVRASNKENIQLEHLFLLRGHNVTVAMAATTQDCQ